MSARNGSSTCSRMPAAAIARYSLLSSAASAWKILLLGLVVFVDADAGRRCRRQEHVMVRHALGLGGRLEAVDVVLQKPLAAVAHGAGADDRHDRHHRAAHHGFLEILRVVFGEGGDLLLEQEHLLVRARLEPVEPLANVSEEAGLGKLPVSDDVDAAVDLAGDAIGDRRGEHPVVGHVIVWLAAVFRLHHVEQRVRARQAADMRRHDAIGVLLDRHRPSPPVRLRA